MRNLLVRLLPLGALLAPFAVAGQVQAVSRIVGVFNIFVGLMLTASILLYGVGLIMWFIRLGTWPSYRTVAVRVLEWAVAVLLVLVVLLAIVQFFQGHPHAAAYVISFIVVAIVIWIIVYLASHSSERKERPSGANGANRERRQG